jgi:thioesterase domain-containing protein
MTDHSIPFVFLPGSGGGTGDLSFLSSGGAICFEQIDYPGWRRYASDDFSAETLIAGLAAGINSRVPHGPIHIVGLSMGGHFGYAAALRLQAMGRQIGGFCAIDSFMIDTAAPTQGWVKRAFGEGVELLTTGRLGGFMRFVRSRFWRALLRLVGDRLSDLCASGRLPDAARIDPILRHELQMRLLVRKVVPWLGSLDDEPVALRAPAVLLRTAGRSGDDEAWRRRCPEIQVYELTGEHHSLFDPENCKVLQEAFKASTREWCENAAQSTSKP